MTDRSEQMNLEDGFLIKTDAENAVLFVSDTCKQFFELPESSLEGKMISETSIGDRIPGFTDSRKKALRSPFVSYSEIRCEVQNKECWVSWTHTGFLSAKGIEAIVSFGREITKSRIAERKLAEERERLAQIIAATKLGTWEWDLRSDQVMINDKWANLLGYELEELKPVTIRTWASLAHPDDLKISNQLIKDLIEGRSEFYELECRMRHKQGHWVWIMDRGSVSRRDLKGYPIEISGTHIEITEKKREEENVLKRLHFLDLVSDMSLKLNRADNDAVYKETLKVLLEKMGEFFGMCRAYLFELNKELSHMQMILEWVKEGVNPEIDNVNIVEIESLPWWKRNMATGDILYIDDVNMMPDEAQNEKKLFKSQDIKALISIPTIGGYGTVSGVLGFDKTDEPYHWSEDEKLMMRIFADLIGNVQERRRIESELKESEERFSTAFNVSPVGMAMAGPDDKYTEVNERYAEIHGFEPSEMIGKSGIELGILTPETLQELKDLMKANNQNVIGNEIEVFLPNGNPRIMDTSLVPIFVQGIPHLLISAVDITERKKWEEEISRRDRILNAVSVAAGHLLKGHNVNDMQPLLRELGQAAKASRAYIFNIFEKDDNETYASQLFEWCAEGIEPQIDNPMLQEARFEDIGFIRWRELMQTGGFISGHVSTFPDDEQAFLEMQDIESILVLPIFVQSEWWGFIGFDQCDSNRSWSKTEVEALETASRIIGSALQRNITEKQVHLQSAALDSAANAIYITNVKGELEWVNPAWSMLTGYTAQEALGKKTSILRSGIHEEKFYETLWKTLLEGDVWSGEIINKKKNGDLYNELQTITPLLNDKNEITHFIGFKQDITDQKQAEHEIKKSLREKEALLSEIHHRVKNNLAVVSGVMQLQAYSSQNEDTKDDLMNSVTRIKTIANVHELLYQSESFTDIDFSDNIIKLQSFLMDTLGGSTPVEHHLDCGRIRIGVSQAMPASLIVNEVLTNAYKHAFRGRKRGNIHITLKEDAGRISLCIRDDGVGIENYESGQAASLGMQLINILSEQLEATHTYEQEEQGTVFKLQFMREKENGISF